MQTEKNNKDLTITVIIPAYNISEYIGRAIESVLAQTRAADEIIIVDDGSTDDTAEKIKSFGDKITYIFQENKGLSGARNTGIKAASSAWIALLDGDDEWLPEYLEKQTELISRNPELVWSAGNYLRCLCDEKRQGASIAIAKVKKLLDGKDYFSNYFYALRNGAGGSANTMMIRREVFERVGMFAENQAFAEDLDMWWRITYYWPNVGFVIEPLSIYHMARAGALSQSSGSSNIVILGELIEKHRKLACEHGQSEQFDLLASRMVTSWIRSLLFQNNPKLIREFMGKFNDLLSLRFKAIIRLLIICPGTTAVVCHAISRIVRTLNLRKKVFRQPRKQEQ
ncbi:MAG TPA: glycosyltransferase [Phycisphaerales bacterium]|nr:glycosyltransferase [Phycisphaerales bacterium]